MHRNPGMNRFFVEAVRTFGPAPGIKRWQYRIRDKDNYRPNFGAVIVATAFDPKIADEIAAALENGAPVSEERWQSTLDYANRQRGLEKPRGDMMKDEADRLRTQLFEAREQLAYGRRTAAIALLANEIRDDVRDCLVRIRNGEPKKCSECGK